MPTIWVLAADASRAKLFATESAIGELTEIKQFDHPEARKHENELASDEPGRTFDSIGGGRHAKGSPVEPKRHEAMEFAKKLADYLDAECQRGAFSKLYVAAAPAFLGMLREHYTPALRPHIAAEVDKDLTQMNAREMRRHLPERL